MIKIIDADKIEQSWFSERNFEGANETVTNIIQNVIENSDSALKEYSKKFDVSCPKNFLIDKDDIKKAADKFKKEKPEVYDAIEYSFSLAKKFALLQKNSFNDFEAELAPGLFTGQKTIPVEKAGVYIPAGRYPILSSVVMTVAPAVAAGVKEIILCTPPRVHPDDLEKAKNSNTGVSGNAFIDGKPYADEGILAAAFICGVEKCYCVGGAQAIAALAYGTESIPNVDVIVGPGNKFVALAKKQVYGKVGIDMVAGPTEVFIIADKSANPKWVAADLLAQAEHDVVAQPVLATDDMEFANKVSEEIEQQLKTLETAKTARESIDNYGRIIITKNLEEAALIANKKAPEHLELAIEDKAILEKLTSIVRNYGSLFIGHYAAEVFGDYSAGLNHTLPTSGAAHYTGGLSVRMFLKTVTTLRVNEGAEGMKKSAVASNIMGLTEGLTAHAAAARIRIE